MDWTRPAPEVARAIRAYDPWPGAVTSLDDRRLKLFRARPSDGGGAPGEVLGAPPDTLRVAAGGGAVDVAEVQLEGRPRMAAAEFLRGRSLQPGTRLG